MAKLGITMINMYVDLVNQEFQPLVDQVQHLENLMRTKVEDDVKKELGIYDLWVKKAQLEMELQQVQDYMNEWTKNKHRDGEWTSKLDQAVNAKIASTKNGIAGEVRDAKAKAIKQIKLSGVSGDTEIVFSELPKTLKTLTSKLEKAIPKPRKKIK